MTGHVKQWTCNKCGSEKKKQNKLKHVKQYYYCTEQGANETEIEENCNKDRGGTAEGFKCILTYTKRKKNIYCNVLSFVYCSCA